MPALKWNLWPDLRITGLKSNLYYEGILTYNTSDAATYYGCGQRELFTRRVTAYKIDRNLPNKATETQSQARTKVELWEG